MTLTEGELFKWKYEVMKLGYEVVLGAENVIEEAEYEVRGDVRDIMDRRTMKQQRQ